MLEHFGTDISQLDPAFVPHSYLDFLARRNGLMTEVETMCKVPIHSNLVHLLDYATVLEGNVMRLFLMLPFVSCGDLLDYLTLKKPTAEMAKSMCLQIVSGIQALHDAGIAHRYGFIRC